MAKRRRKRRNSKKKTVRKPGVAAQLRAELEFAGADGLSVVGRPFGHGWTVFRGKRALVDLRRRKRYGRYVYHVELGNLTVSATGLAEVAEMIAREANR